MDIILYSEAIFAWNKISKLPDKCTVQVTTFMHRKFHINIRWALDVLDTIDFWWNSDKKMSNGYNFNFKQNMKMLSKYLQPESPGIYKSFQINSFIVLDETRPMVKLLKHFKWQQFWFEVKSKFCPNS
jgi:hypothetical protein